MEYIQTAFESLNGDVQEMEGNYSQLESKFDEIERRIYVEAGEGPSNQDEIKEYSDKKIEISELP